MVICSWFLINSAVKGRYRGGIEITAFRRNHIPAVDASLQYDGAMVKSVAVLGLIFTNTDIDCRVLVPGGVRSLVSGITTGVASGDDGVANRRNRSPMVPALVVARMPAVRSKLGELEAVSILFGRALT